MAAVLAELAERQARFAPRPLVPVHGAPHPHQWLDQAGRLGLVDFDRFALGDAELDLATLLAELDSERDAQVGIGELSGSAIAGYASGGVRLDTERLAVYRAHKRLATLSRTACSMRPDGHLRALRQLGAVGGHSHPPTPERRDTGDADALWPLCVA